MTNTTRPSVPILDAIWNRLGADSAEETPHGFRRQDHCGTTVLRFEKFLEKIPGFELLGIVEIETRFNPEIVPELDEETLERINSRCVWGSFDRKGEELALTMQYSVYGQDSAYRMASELIVRAFYEQSQMGAGILHHTVSPENREEIQDGFAFPAEWPVPLEYDDYEEAAMVFRQNDFGAHASPIAFTVTVPFSEDATPQTSAFLRVTAHARHPVAGAGYGAPSMVECLRHSLGPDNKTKVIPQRSAWTPPVMQDIAYEYSHMGGVDLFDDHVTFHLSKTSKLELWPTDNNPYWGGGLLALTIVDKESSGVPAGEFDVNSLNQAANLYDAAPTFGAWCDEGSQLIFASFLPNLFGKDPKFNNYLVAWARDRVNLLPDLARVALGKDE